MLGLQRVREGDSAVWFVHPGFRRLGAFVWDTVRTVRLVCWGEQLESGQLQRCRLVRSLKSPPAARIRVGCGLMVRWSAGAATFTERRQRRGVRSPRFPPAPSIRVGCGLMVRWSAGAGTNTGEATAPSGSFTQVSAGVVAFVWDTCRMGRWSAGATTGPGRRRRRMVRSLRSPPAARIRVGYVPEGSVVCWGDNNVRAGDGAGWFVHPGLRRQRVCIRVGYVSGGSVVCWG